MRFLESAWYRKAGWLILLWPVAMLYRVLASFRRKSQEAGRRPPGDKMPIVVIGNISVGGTGKTPLIIGLATHLIGQGFKPGIISRGYGGKSDTYPLAVTADSSVAQCGDEAILLAAKTEAPVVIAPDRVAALNHLVAKEDVNVIFSDDGLQHYRLPRDIEICVVDGQRLFGNGFCLPAGPLREPISRLEETDYVVVNGLVAERPDSLSAAIQMELLPKYLVNLATEEKRPFGGAPFNMGSTVQAVSALGNPERFYTLLQKLPYPLQKFSFPDHYLFTAEDFSQHPLDEHQPVVMTEKDAVKCRGFARNNYWYLSTELSLPPAFLDEFTARVRKLTE